MRIALLVLLGGLGGLLNAAEGAVDDAQTPLDPATVARAEAAADAFLADAEATGSPAVPSVEAVVLDRQQRSDLSQVGVLLLEATAHLEAGQGLPAGERYLQAQALLAALPQRAADPQQAVQLTRARGRLLQIGQLLLADGHLGTPSDELQANEEQGLVE